MAQSREKHFKPIDDARKNERVANMQNNINEFCVSVSRASECQLGLSTEPARP